MILGAPKNFRSRIVGSVTLPRNENCSRGENDIMSSKTSQSFLSTLSAGKRVGIQS